MKTNKKMLIVAASLGMSIALAGCSSTGGLTAVAMEAIDTRNEVHAKMLVAAEHVMCEKVDTGVAIQRYNEYALRMAFIKICNHARDMKYLPKSLRE